MSSGKIQAFTMIEPVDIQYTFDGGGGLARSAEAKFRGKNTIRQGLLRPFDIRVSLTA